MERAKRVRQLELFDREADGSRDGKGDSKANRRRAAGAFVARFLHKCRLDNEERKET